MPVPRSMATSFTSSMTPFKSFESFIEPFMQTDLARMCFCNMLCDTEERLLFSFFCLGFFSCICIPCLARNGRVGHIKLNLLLLTSHWITREFLARIFLAVFRNAPKILGKHYKLDVNGIRETAATSFAS